MMALALSPAWAPVNTPVIGMVHLRPLIGAPRFDGDVAAVRDAALRDAEALQAGGVHGLMIENFGDVPFYRDRVPAETIAHMTAVAAAVGAGVDVPMGVNVLRNDAEAALAIARAVGAAFVRVNVLHGTAAADQGLIEGRAAALMRKRRELGAEGVKVLADVRVKHAKPVVERDIGDEARELVHRCLADGVIVSGAATGAAVELERLRQVREAVGAAVPVWIGSGADTASAAALAELADGVIVGTHFKRNGDVAQPVDVDRVRRFIERLHDRRG